MAVQENILGFGRVVWAQQGNNAPQLFVVTNASGSATTLGAPISNEVINQLQTGQIPDVSINPTGVSDIEGKIQTTDYYLDHDQILLAARRGVRKLLEEDYPTELAEVIAGSVTETFETSLAEAVEQEKRQGIRRS